MSLILGILPVMSYKVMTRVMTTTLLLSFPINHFDIKCTMHLGFAINITTLTSLGFAIKSLKKVFLNFFLIVQNTINCYQSTCGRKSSKSVTA